MQHPYHDCQFDCHSIITRFHHPIPPQAQVVAELPLDSTHSSSVLLNGNELVSWLEPSELPSCPPAVAPLECGTRHLPPESIQVPHAIATEADATYNLSLSHHWHEDLMSDKYHPPQVGLSSPLSLQSTLTLGRTLSPAAPASNDLELGISHESLGDHEVSSPGVEPSGSSNVFNSLLLFLSHTLPRMLYLVVMLCLPAMYFCRITRVFAHVKTDIQRIPPIAQRNNTSDITSAPPVTVDERGQMNGVESEGSSTATMNPAEVSPSSRAYRRGGRNRSFSPYLPFPSSTPHAVPSKHREKRFKQSWYKFIDERTKELKTLNIVSALLASANLTILQVPQVTGDLTTRTLSLLSVICALMSLSYGCIIFMRFGTMRTMAHAHQWVEEVQRTSTSILWNGSVLLAAPAVWTAWGMLLLLSAIVSFVWKADYEINSKEKPPLDAKSTLIARISVSTTICVGIIYAAAIIRTLVKYGSYKSYKGLNRALHEGTLRWQPQC